ncbi:MAG: LysM peptidoglycan-binding domain-containing protein [Candidatus Comchoanobacterales bacterium]
MFTRVKKPNLTIKVLSGTLALILMTVPSVSYGFGQRNDLLSDVVRHFAVPLPKHSKRINHQLAYFQKDVKALLGALSQAQPYLSYIVAECKSRNLPTELALLPYIESRYQLHASSSQGAVGLWQMMPGTASAYGVNIDHWFDGRLDLKNSTDGALDHLQYLYEQFNHNWLLAIAAYDAGEGRVKRAVKKRKILGQSTDFWSLDLPKETRDYVPKLLALKQFILNQYHYHKISSTIPFEITEVQNQQSFKYIKSTCKVNLDIYHLNDANMLSVTPPNQKHYLYIAKDQLDDYYDCLPTIDQRQVSISQYSVKPNDTLSGIALEHKTSVRKIMKHNHMSDHIIKPGQTLYIPSPKFDEPLQANDRIGPQPIIHQVKKGDSLHSIALKYKVKTAHICYWNQISASKALQPKQKLTIWPKQKRRVHTVKPNESLSVIAHRYKTTVKKIMLDNHLSSVTIKPNQRLLISG